VLWWQKGDLACKFCLLQHLGLYRWKLGIFKYKARLFISKFSLNVFMAALRSRCGHYIFVRLLSSFFLLFYCQSGCLPYFYTWCGLSASFECRSEMCCTWPAGNTWCKNDAKKSPSRQHRTTLLGCIFANKAYIGNWKSSNTSSTCPCNIMNFSPLTAEIGSGVWGTPANFNGFCVLALLLLGTLVLGVSQTLWRWTEGATYIRQGSHHVVHQPTF